ncbi:MAG: glycine cleavage system protein T [Rhizobiales bacterium]|nr:glycine cleavage system protein T [Hyphomicrobiales bacterium]
MAFSIAIGPRVRKSPFFEATVKAGVTGFTIYNHMYMPVSYGDPLGEYWRLVEGVSMWDVACERQVEIAGPDAGKLAQYLTPRNLSGQVVGQGKYVPICDHAGTLLNDPILLKLSEEKYWLSIADNDLLFWVRAIANERGFKVAVSEPDASPLAVQGPLAEEVVAGLVGDWVRQLKYFWFRPHTIDGIPLIIQRSGWSKQGGFELYLLDASRGGDLWRLVAAAGKRHGIAPGCPNAIERVESGLISVGGDTFGDTNPLELTLAHYCDLDQRAAFIGKEALRRIRDEGPKRRQVGLIVAGRALDPTGHRLKVLRKGRQVGWLTALAHSPRLKQNVAMALLDRRIKDGADDLVVVLENGKERAARMTGLPFCK